MNANEYLMEETQIILTSEGKKLRAQVQNLLTQHVNASGLPVVPFLFAIIVGGCMLIPPNNNKDPVLTFGAICLTTVSVSVLLHSLFGKPWRQQTEEDLWAIMTDQASYDAIRKTDPDLILKINVIFGVNKYEELVQLAKYQNLDKSTVP